MKKLSLIFIILLSFNAKLVLAQEEAYPLEAANVNIEDKDSLQRGLRNFIYSCFGCHSMKFQRYERVANDLGIPEDIMMQYMIFNPGIKFGDLMTNSMDEKDAKQWFGATPPDLNLITRAKGVDWVYTYLKTFYEDELRPYGVNNKVYPDVGMPHVLIGLQGVQVDTCGPNDDPELRDPLTGEKLCGLKVDSSRKGSMTPEQYDQFVYDIVNFLHYSAEPFKKEREYIGVYVLLFLLLFFVFAYLLKREYWKDVD
jgi:ubiquinol-cytochrome c reductase cytochrome c1 subunit